MKPYRCVNPECADRESGFPKPFRFFAAEGVCPKCGASLKDPESRHLIAALTPLHFHPPGKWGTGKRVGGVGVLACTGEAFKGAQATGDPTVVTCPDCKLTQEWRDAAAKWGYRVIEEISDERKEELLKASKLMLKAFDEKYPGHVKAG